MRTKIALLSTLAAMAALVPTAVSAQEAAPGAKAPEAPAASAEASPPASPAPSAEPAPTAPAAWPGWIRADHDGGGLQLWGGATAPLADGLGLAFDMYVNSGTLGEFDIGPAISVSTLTLTPMIGAQFNWAERAFVALVPQLYLTGPLANDKLYNELWIQYYNYKVVRETGIDTYLYVREFIDYKISSNVGVGPQVELTQNFTQSKLTNLPVGGNVMLNMGLNSTLFFFLGYETKQQTPDNRAAGRLTFVHNF
jgi:hypothetical protein